MRNPSRRTVAKRTASILLPAPAKFFYSKIHFLNRFNYERNVYQNLCNIILLVGEQNQIEYEIVKYVENQ